LLAEAEAAGSVPWHMRDENTGAPIDFTAHPKAHWYTQNIAAGPYLYHVSGEEPIWRTGTAWAVDGAHEPALAYVAYLLTDDPYFLEELQFQTGWTIGWTFYARNSAGTIDGLALPPIINPGETREYAWGLRTLAENAKVAPASPPKWLLPQSYFERVLKVNRLWYEGRTINSSVPEVATFHVPVDTGLVGS